MKILIISHTPISTFNNMGKTIGSLFSSFTKNELCQLYIHPSVPDIPACNSYYRITDRDILMSYIKFYVCGGVVFPNIEQHNCSDDSKSGRLYRRLKHIGTTKRLVRDILWYFAHWYNKKLKEWIEKENPTHIFVAPGMQRLLYDIAFCIAKDRNIPIITYICDDYFFLQKKRNPIIRYANWHLRCKIEKLMRLSNHVVFICNPLKEAYQARFDILATTIMTGTSNLITNEVICCSSVKSFVYLGNLYYNREKSLADIGIVLDELNKEYGMACRLDIYSGDISDTIKNSFNGIKSINLHGFVIGTEYENVKSQADVLIHVEAFDEDSYDMVKFSISTKIADILSSGKVLLAYGPPNVASIRHLTDNGYICSVFDKKELKKKINLILIDKQFRVDCIKQSLSLASKYHNKDLNSESLRKIFYNIYN